MKSRTRNLVIIGAVLVGIITGLGLFSLFLSCSRAPHTEHLLPPPPLSSVELVDESVRQLDWGNIAFNAPASMRYAQPQIVELLLSPSLSVADLQAQLQQKVGVESARAQISNRMEAQLTGSGFGIEAQMPDLQAVTSQQATRWTWKVTPTGHGPQTLHLTLSAHIDVAGRDAPLVVRTFDRDIQVSITIPQRVSGFIQKNWQWLWAAIVLPIAGYLWRRRKKVPQGFSSLTALDKMAAMSPGSPNVKLFINYRRDDTAPYAGRLYDRLTAHFGADQVFIDIDQIEPGEDFVEVINRKVGACEIAVVSIGPNWLSATDASGKRRLDDEEDFVRMEIIAALERKIRVIPVLVGGARMPQREDLPEALAPLSRRNAIELSETRFHADVNRLIEAIEKARASDERLKTKDD